MNTAPEPTADVYLVVGYDGSEPATRALDAAIRLLRGRSGRIDVVYVGHVPSIDMMSADAIVEVEASFDDIAKELRAQAEEQLRGREDRWRFERAGGEITEITDTLIAKARQISEAHPDDNVAIVVGSSSHAVHRMVGSVAVGLARRSPVPVVVVP
jgi:nucleotide-binding universal stress UspA family protein